MKNEKHRVHGMLIGEYVQKSIKRLFEEKINIVNISVSVSF